MADSPGSPLSSHASSEFLEDVKSQDHDASINPYATVPAAKRQKTGYSSYRSTPQYDGPVGDEVWLSDDTDGSVPNSPVAPPTMIQEEDNSEQVTICRWKDCEKGDLGNLDKLVQHLRDEHIEGSGSLGQKGKRYVCEWEGCPRQDAAPTTAYAMRSHMRSHTREKPFLCAVPECDKAFTRSDALVKHMRTVHETDAVRPVETSLKTQNIPPVKPPKIKLTFKKGQAATNGHSPDADSENGVESGTKTYPSDLNFSPEHLAMPPEQLYKLMRRQVYWAEQEGRTLRKKCAELESELKKEWTEKELLLFNVIEAELASAVHEHRTSEEKNVWEMVKDLLPNHMMPVSGEAPWYRKPPASAD